MKLLADAGGFFFGQGVTADGIAWHADYADVPDSQKLEFPVAEELNVGAAVGLSLTGVLPVVCIPRMDFLLRAADQIVNHLDKLEEMSAGQFVPKVIIRTRVGSRAPLDPGPQHRQNHSEAFRHMLTRVGIWEVEYPADILPAYQFALESPRSTLVVEAL